MAAGEFRIFISAVTSEFGKARDALAADLRSRDTLVRVQSDFRQETESDTTLKKLHDYIRDCSSVVFVGGGRSGACPPRSAAAPFGQMLPSGISEASYTQWEFFFARHYRRRLSIYIANDDYVPDQPTPTGEDHPDLQQALVRHIVEEQGLDRSYFSNVDQLCRAVLKEDWPRKRPVKPILLPYPSLGSLFKGRAAFMRQLRDSLARTAAGRAAIVSQALYGLGGIGKTRAAVEYAWAHQEEYSALLLVTADTPEALRRNIAALAVPLLLSERDATDDTVRLQAVLNWFKANPGWLLILDNVDTPSALAEAEKLIGQVTDGRLLMTSRLANFPGDVQPLELDLLPVDDAVDFLLERTAGRRRMTSDDRAKARELALDLGRLALALEHAGAYIVRHRASFSQYSDLWRGSRDKVMNWADPTVTHYPRAVAVTWQTSVARLTHPARHLLELVAWLAPEPVPEFLLEVPIPEAEGNDLQEALADLAGYSLATRDAEEPRFFVHRLVQDVTRRSLDADTSHCRLFEALRWITAAFTGDPRDPRTWPRLEALAPHALAVTRYADDTGLADPTPGLMNRLGLLLKTKTLYAEAEPLYRRALTIAENSFGPEHPEVAAHLSNLGQLLQATNRLAEAELLMRRALALAENSFGPEHPNVAAYLNNLGGLLRETNRLTEAELLMRRALAVNENSFGSDHPVVAINLDNLGILLQSTNRPAEAEPLMRRALAIDEESFRPDHPNVAIRFANLGHLLHATNRPAEAEPLVRRALAIDEESFGPDHPRVATRLGNHGRLLQTTNWFAEAEPLYRRALAIDEKSFGPNHPNVAIRLNNLGQLLQATNRLGEAEPLHRRALAINENNFGPDHPSVARDLNDLGELLRETNRPAEAEPLMRRALAIVENSVGPNHAGVAIFLNNLGELLHATNRLAEAEPLMRRTVKITEKSLGPDHPNLAVHLNNLGRLLQDANRLADAEPLMRRALAINENSFGPDHTSVAIGLDNLGGLLQATNRFAEAEPLHRRALAIDENIFGPDHPTVAIRLSNIGRLLRATNRPAEAEPLMRRALAINENSFGPDHPDVARDLYNLGTLLLDTNRLADAESLMRRALAILIDFEPRTGHRHPHRDAAARNYVLLLAAMGKSEAEVRAAIDEVTGKSS
jgi:tetratricopeptide (TPR) repeat protein